MPETPKHISVVYEHSKAGVPTIAATGAFGGTSPDQSSVVAHLYVEHGTTPSHVIHQVEEGGIIDLRGGEETKRGDVTRTIQARLVLSPEAAVSLGHWLTRHGQQAIDARGNNQ
jgi:hypothetical protein